MNNYYFTFGSQHFTKDGFCLEGYYITVQAFNWEQARSLFLNHFMAKKMNALTDFSYQYDSFDFEKLMPFYQNGEYEKFILLDLSEVE